MKTTCKIFTIFAVLTLVFMVSCTKDQATDLSQEQNLEKSLDRARAKAKLIKETNIQQQRVPINYTSFSCGDDEVTAIHDTPGSIFNPAFFDYYSFEGTAGDVIDIAVIRATEDLDPWMALYFGTTGDTSDGFDAFSGSSNMEWLGLWDDNGEFPIPECYLNPEVIGFELPYTGTYTLAVGDFQGCGSSSDFGTENTRYEIITSCMAGVTDADGDGCLDADDPHPNSNMEATVIIDGCDSGIDNVFVTDCSTMSDLIADCAATAVDHGDFVSCVSHLTNAWKSEGYIVGNEKGDIMSCAAISNLP